MAVTDAQIRAVLAANPNASDARILKALANYGVSPERFTAVTGRTLGATATTTPATPAPAPVVPSYQAPSYTNMNDAELYAAAQAMQPQIPVYQQPAPVPAPVVAPRPVAPVPAPAPVVTRPATAPAPAPAPVVAPRPVPAPTPTPAPVVAPRPAPAPVVTTPAPVVTQTPTPAQSPLTGNKQATTPASSPLAPPAPNPVATPAPAVTQPTGPTDDEIRNIVRMAKSRAGGNNLDAIGLLVSAMGNVGITPERLSQVINVPVGTINQYVSDYQNKTGAFAQSQAPVTQPVTPTVTPATTTQTAQTPSSPLTGAVQPAGYTDQQIRDAVMNRARQQGFVTQEELQKAAQNYGVSPEQLASALPQVQPGSLNQAPITTQQSGLMPAVEAIGRAADVTRETSLQGQRELLDRLSALEGRLGGIYDTAQGYQQTYRDLGQEAAQRQAALTGALGPEAQAQAFAEYQASPALDFLQRQSERALTRQAAAMGGLGGGNVRQDLVKLTADLYGQDYANQFARLGEIAQRGYGAAGTSAQLGSAQAGTIAGVGQAGATTAAQMQDALSGRLANVLGTEAQYRLRAGENIADAIAAGASGISGLQVGASDAYRNIYGNLTDAQLQTAKDLATQYGNAVANQYLAQANAYQGQGSALAGVPAPTFTPVPGYNIGGAIGAGGRAYDLAGTLFGGQQQKTGTGVPYQTPFTPGATPASNMQYFPGGPTTSDLLKIPGF